MLSKERMNAISKATEILSMYSPEIVQCMKNMSVVPVNAEPPFDNWIGSNPTAKIEAPVEEEIKAPVEEEIKAPVEEAK